MPTLDPADRWIRRVGAACAHPQNRSIFTVVLECPVTALGIDYSTDRRSCVPSPGERSVHPADVRSLRGGGMSEFGASHRLWSKRIASVIAVSLVLTLSDVPTFSSS